MDPGFRRDDGDVWIPASAGTTGVWVAPDSRKKPKRKSPAFAGLFHHSQIEPYYGFSTFSSVRRLRARPSLVAFVSIGCDSPKPLTAVMRLASTPCEVR